MGGAGLRGAVWGALEKNGFAVDDVVIGHILNEYSEQINTENFVTYSLQNTYRFNCPWAPK